MLQEPVLQLRGARPGPTLVVLAAVHGNEPAGVRALESLARRIASRGGLRSGELVGLVGNPPAFRAGRRYMETDLNRIWMEPPSGVRDLREGQQRRRITRILAAARRRARGELHVVDLHTTSGTGPPFIVVGASPWGLELGRSLPLPLVEGLARRLPGTFTQWLDEQGVANLVLEAGPHTGAESPDHARALLEVVAARLGLTAPEVEDARGLLVAAGRGLPRRLVLSARHPVHPGDEFQMEPGYGNLDPVHRGQLLARDRRGPIHSPADGWLLLPLYQLQGTDGFFLATPPEGAAATGHPQGEAPLAGRADGMGPGGNGSLVAPRTRQRQGR